MSLARNGPMSRIEKVTGIPRFVAGELLGEGVAEAHVHGAFDLPRAERRIYRSPDVVGGDDLAIRN